MKHHYTLLLVIGTNTATNAARISIETFPSGVHVAAVSPGRGVAAVRFAV